MSDPYVEHLRAGRDSSARQKIRLAQLRAKYPQGYILSVEGADDKQVYLHWIRRIAPQLPYEALVCETKDEALKLLDALRRDETGLSKDVYFLLDSDFDGLKGRQPGDEVYLTAAYSIENYLVHSGAVADVLNIELHCNGEPQCRRSVLAAFEAAYAKFLQCTRRINLRIFVSRRARIRQTNALPVRISDLSDISLFDAAAGRLSAEQAVVLEREPTADELATLNTDFDTLIPPIHYRGKFALMFFLRWLHLLAAERRDPESELFKGVNSDRSPSNNFTLDMLAARSQIPAELPVFLERMTQR